MLGVALVPLVVLGLVVLEIQRRGLSRAEKELEAAVVDEAASTIVASLDEAASVAARTQAVFADETLDVDARMRRIDDIARMAKSISGIAFFDEENRFVDAVVREPDDTLSTPPSREASRPSQDGFRVLENGAVRYEAGLDGSPKGFLVVGVARLDRRLRDLSRVRFSAPDRVYLVDESHRVLGGSDRAGHRPDPPIFAASGLASATFAAELVLTTEFRDGGIDKVGTIRTMPKQRWALVVERPTSEAFAALASARTAFLLSLAGFAVIAALAGILVVRQVVSPIAALMRLAGHYGRRDFGARSNVNSGDELEALGTSLERMADDLATSEVEIAKRARIEANLRRYLPEQAADAAANALNLGGARKRVTILFADVVAFTGFAERTSPERAVALLNELFTILSEIVFRHDGMVDKFIGDCIMAVFDDVGEALAAAEDMHAFVASNLPRWREAYAFDVELGIGVAAGDALVGNLGSEARMEYTAIGDAVNVAARLESLARPRQTLTTKEVVDACPDVAFASLGSHALRGKANPVEVFEVVS